VFPRSFIGLVPKALKTTGFENDGDKITLLVEPVQDASSCPGCGQTSHRIHSHYQRDLADLPWNGRIVKLRLRARRFRCSEPECETSIFTERVSEAVRPGARRSLRLADSQLAIGLAAGGEPGSRLARKLAMPVSGDTILRLVRAAHLDPPVPPRVVGIDDWAWRRGTRYGTIIVDLERNRVIDLLPDRSAGSVATWLKRHPGIEIIARDRAGVYADGARHGAPGALQIADRWHLLSNLGDALRNILGKHRKAVNVANQLVLAGKDPVGPSARPQALAMLRADRRNARKETFAEILRLRERGLTPSHIAPIVGMETRAVQRWLAAGGEPEHTRPLARTSLIDPFHDYLFQRWQEGCRVGRQLLEEIRARGYRGGHATLFRHLAIWRDGPIGRPSWKPLSRRRCAWLLSRDPNDLDAESRLFLGHLKEHAPQAVQAGILARQFAKIINGDDAEQLDPWLVAAEASELNTLAKGIRRDIDAVRAAITEPWTTSPVEGQINRVKAIKRQMYGRAKYLLLKQRVLIAA
jgi:transposase